MARSLGELRSFVLAHVWGPPPVQFPGNSLADPGGVWRKRRWGMGMLTPAPVYEE